MSYSETITRTDLTNILNEVLPFSFTEFRNQSGNITVANSTLVQAHSETFTDGSWLILTTLETLSGGSTTANTGQNRIIKDGALVYAHKSQADVSIVNTNFYVLKNANNTTISLESFQVTGNSQSQEWTFTAIRIGDKFAEPSADYIVEQGTSGIWTYRKWNSGVAECWGTYTSGNISVASRNGWYSGECIPDNFPTGLFNSVPKMSTNCTTWGTGFHFSFAYSVTSSGCKVGGIRNDLVSSPMTVDIFATGTWK